uniref:Uncharacterized protein n=1 Tax=Naja naja TaxID=35670 RepID=A0A8C6VE19_NAJNA
ASMIQLPLEKLGGMKVMTRIESFLWLFLGGNSGIGKATAVDLARRGARVILGCRNKARGESAMYDIRRESGNSEVILMILDLGNLNSVRAFAQTFLASEPRLDILINNAGVLKAGQTADGFDQAFQVNYLAHFLLTHLLLDRLKRCAPSRIVILSSIAHICGKIDFQTMHKPGKVMQNALHSYSNSKLANLLHARELARRLEGTNVTCYAVHPGEWKSSSKAPQMEQPDPDIPLSPVVFTSFCSSVQNEHSCHCSSPGEHLSPCIVRIIFILRY